MFFFEFSCFPQKMCSAMTVGGWSVAATLSCCKTHESYISSFVSVESSGPRPDPSGIAGRRFGVSHLYRSRI
jgi:hypothetical protein